MSHALEKWDRLISDTPSPENLSDFLTRPDSINEVLDQSRLDLDKVRKQVI
jgi:anion-transporting  ArsA/GET3 family ATPase